jgi:preprotein translocase subunit YajC
MLISPAYAQDMGGATATIVQFAPIILIFVVFYFLLIRPQQQAQKTLKAKLAALKRNDRVVTGGGIIGTVQRTIEGSNEVEVEIAPNVRIKVIRETITGVLGEPKPANDTKTVEKG